MSNTSFRTLLRRQPLSFQLHPQHKLLSLGSCFAAHMGQRLVSHKLDTLVNPGGILFNPISITKVIRLALQVELPTTTTTTTPFRRADHLPVWHHFDWHSEMSRPTEQEAQENLQNVLHQIRKRIRELDCLIVTLGTARVYTYQDQVVANCHKYPHALFQRRLLTLDELHRDWEITHAALLQERPNLQTIVTVSPVRHTRDGLSENSVSKALLRVFCDQLVMQHDHNNIHYFPAYELLLDDLRDYRFYEKDMIHPNEIAQDYIWQAFQEMVLSDTAQQQVREWEQIRRDLDHKPLYPGSPAHRRFLESIQTKLNRQPDFVDVSPEQTHLQALLQQPFSQ